MIRILRLENYEQEMKSLYTQFVILRLAESRTEALRCQQLMQAMKQDKALKQ